MSANKSELENSTDSRPCRRNQVGVLPKSGNRWDSDLNDVAAQTPTGRYRLPHTRVMPTTSTSTQVTSSGDTTRYLSERPSILQINTNSLFLGNCDT